MEVVITEWALQAYLDLKKGGVFTRQEYRSVIRPDVERLKLFPNDPAFQKSKFWGPATDKAGNQIRHGFKMKWHQIGSGHMQLRLAVAILAAEALLCRAYVKDTTNTDKREMAKLKLHISLILK
ncbi:MAG: hypothetical protein ABUS79_18800 [Pseudomonadota bacterium]